MSHLRTARVRRHLHLTTLSKKSGVSYSTLIRAERGARISEVNQQKIADALGVERSELFPETEAVA